MAHKLSNDAVLEQLKNGIAQFELVSSPVPLISTSISQANPTALFRDYNHRFFAKTGFPMNLFSFDSGQSSSMRKIETTEYYSVQEVTADARCLFRALAKGMAANDGYSLEQKEETDKAEALRQTVERILCRNEVRPKYKAALKAITDNQESLKSYCDRIRATDFCGGKPELLVLSEQLEQPIIVYEHTNDGRSGFIFIHKYGSKFSEGSGTKPVRLLKSGRNRYDLVVS